MPVETYTLEQAEDDIAVLRGQSDRMSEVITKNDSTDPPNGPAAGIIHYSAGGHHKYASADTGFYNTGHVFLRTTANQTINSTSQVTAGANSVPLQVPVTAGMYYLRSQVTWTQGGVQANQAARVNGPAVTDMLVTMLTWTRSTTGGSVFAYDANTINADLGTPLGAGGTGYPNGTVNIWEIEGYCNFSAAGTLSVDARCVTLSTDTFVVNAGSFLLVMAVT